MTRKVTVQFELPEDLCQVLEQQANATGRALEVVLAEYWARHHRGHAALEPQEALRRRTTFERHFGSWQSDSGDSSDNTRIDRDLATEYRRHSPRGD